MCDSDKVHVINAYIQGVFFNLVILIVRRFRGRGSVEGFMEGRQCRDIFRGGPVKKTPCTYDLIRIFVPKSQSDV